MDINFCPPSNRIITQPHTKETNSSGLYESVKCNYRIFWVGRTLKGHLSYHICHILLDGYQYISKCCRWLQTTGWITFWSVGFYDFVKNVLKYLLALYMQNLNGRCKQAVSDHQHLWVGASQVSVVGSTREALKRFLSWLPSLPTEWHWLW